MLGTLEQYLQSADLERFGIPSEDWTIEGSSSALSYATHGIFRYFGKFPPPVAKRFIGDLHSRSSGPVVDLTIGSGTTGVEAMLAGCDCVGVDANPLSCLVSRVKTTSIPQADGEDWSERFRRYSLTRPSVDDGYYPVDRYLGHWFHDATIEELARIRQYIDVELVDETEQVRDAHSVALAGIVRGVSRASNGLARMFLDPAIGPADVASVFAKRLDTVREALKSLDGISTSVDIVQQDARLPVSGLTTTDLVIVHPPYFNVYRYSSLYKFEMLWLGMDYKGTRKREIRDGFKMGKPELLPDYVEDMTHVLANCSSMLCRGGHLVLMMGDTHIHERRINTTAALLDRLSAEGSDLLPTQLVVRKPKYTEASYAAGQRRTKDDIGIKLWDHILVMAKS